MALGVGENRVTGQVTLSGNEITDLVRIAAASWPITRQGGQVDVASIPGGVYIDRAATNDFTRGQCDSLGVPGSGIWAIAVGAAGTAALDATTPAPWSPQSLKCTGNGSAAATWEALNGQGSAIAASTTLVGSVLASLVAGQTYTVFMISINTDTSITNGATTTITAGDGSRPSITVVSPGHPPKTYELLTAPAMTVAVGKTCDRYGIRVQQTSGRTETVWLAHAMLEHGQPYVAPYVATSGGARATAPLSKVQMPSALLNAAQGWVGVYFRAGDPSSDPTNILGIFGWTDGSAQNGVYCYAINGTLHVYRAAAGVSTHADTAVSWNVGDMVLVVGAWDAGNVYAWVSVNGGALASAQNANVVIPTGLGATFDVGDLQYTTSPINGSVYGSVCGSSVPTAAQVVALSARFPARLVRHLADVQAA